MNHILFPPHIALGGCLKPVTARKMPAMRGLHSSGPRTAWVTQRHGKTRDSPGVLAFRLSQMLPVWLGGSMDDGYDTGDKNVRLVSGADEET